MIRAQKSIILRDLGKKMVFLTGPRQVGKTWLAKDLMKEFKYPLYLNYDDFEHQKVIKNRSWPQHMDLIVFDEIHKMKKWKNYLKGLYDTKPAQLSVLVTGSARLDTFRYSGDSLAGRFFLHRLLPFSLSELAQPIAEDEMKLMVRGGFPEAFLAKEDADANRWRLQYIQGLIRFDLLDFERIHDLRAIQRILEILRRSVGSTISYQSISEDIGVALNTVKKYIQILEDLFIVFRVTPYSTNIRRSIKKEPKIYFYDTGMVIGDEGARFENYVAISLYKHLLEIEDQTGSPTRLHYLKVKAGAEVDFCTVVNDQVVQIIEAKLSDKSLHRGLRYFCDKYPFKGVQLFYHGQVVPQEIGAVSIQGSFGYFTTLPHL